MLLKQHKCFSAGYCKKKAVVCVQSVHRAEVADTVFDVASSSHDNVVDRRAFLACSWISVASTSALFTPSSASAEDFIQRGLSKYIKKKKLDPLDTYVPVVLEARDQLVASGEVFESTPAVARDFLRKGAFDGLRENIRVLGEYAVINKKEDKAGPLVNGFFTAIEAYDQCLAISVRSEKPVDAEEAKQKLEASVKALDALLATVPEDIMDRSRKILEIARAKAAAEVPQAEIDLPIPGVPSEVSGSI